MYRSALSSSHVHPLAGTRTFDVKQLRSVYVDCQRTFSVPLSFIAFQSSYLCPYSPRPRQTDPTTLLTYVGHIELASSYMIVSDRHDLLEQFHGFLEGKTPHMVPTSRDDNQDCVPCKVDYPHYLLPNKPAPYASWQYQSPFSLLCPSRYSQPLGLFAIG
jgi:hypothetical protein